MKKLLLASTVLTLCSLSILIFQMSCSKTAQAQTSTYILPPATTTTLGGVIVGTGLTVSSNGTLSTTPATGGLTQLGKILIEEGYSNDSLLIMNYDGTNPTQVILPVPAGQYMVYGGSDVALSPDGKTIFFQTSGTVSSAPPFYFYSCNIDGSGRKLIYTSNASANTPVLLGAY